MTYNELVKEAIKRAYEEVEAKAEATKNQVEQFEVGKTYYTRSVCNHDCIFSVKVLKRTAKTVVVLKDGKEKRCKIGLSWNGKEETITPWGVYSMCPVIGASDIAA